MHSEGYHDCDIWEVTNKELLAKWAAAVLSGIEKFDEHDLCTDHGDGAFEPGFGIGEEFKFLVRK